MYVGSDDGNLYAFDAAGVNGCAGTPITTCAPLWTGIGNDLAMTGAPTVAGGVVYIGTHDGTLYAFGTSGVDNCSGAPPTRTCTPLFTAPTNGDIGTSPAVANGTVYVGTGTQLYAFDAAGLGHCFGGPPPRCDPLWVGTLNSGFVNSSPAVAGGVVYVGTPAGQLYAFDAAGGTNCSGIPKTCPPLWTGATGGPIHSSPAVANGVVYVSSDDHKVYAFDAAGATGCSGTPKTCTALWTGTTGDTNNTFASFSSSPTVAGGVVYVGEDDGKVYAFDAAGTNACSGSPKNCTPLWTATLGNVSGVYSSATVLNGVVYIGSHDGNLDVFGLP